MLRISNDLVIEDWELIETFHRASGPGGQNVNKVNTAVALRFEAQNSPNLTSAVKTRLKRLAGQRWTADGAIILRSDLHRSQALNRKDARQRLTALIQRALQKPKPRLKTKPSARSIARRLERKSRRSEVKSLRRTPSLD